VPVVQQLQLSLPQRFDSAQLFERTSRIGGIRTTMVRFCFSEDEDVKLAEMGVAAIMNPSR
jgi:hypothetical protein